MDKLHWTEASGLCDNHLMRPNRSILGWLGLAIVALVIVVLVRLSGGSQPQQETDKTASLTTPSAEPETLLAAAMHSPVPAPANPEAVPLRSNQLEPTTRSHLPLTVIFTNDTWGYLRPCG